MAPDSLFAIPFPELKMIYEAGREEMGRCEFLNNTCNVRVKSVYKLKFAVVVVHVLGPYGGVCSPRVWARWQI